MTSWTPLLLVPVNLFGIIITLISLKEFKDKTNRTFDNYLFTGLMLLVFILLLWWSYTYTYVLLNTPCEEIIINNFTICGGL